MERKIMFYWQELSKRYSANQVFLVLVYWILSTYRQISENQESPDDIDDWRTNLLLMFKEALNYDVKEAAVRLSERIEWSLLECDRIALRVLMDFSQEVRELLSENDNMTNQLLEMMETLFHIAAINTLYSTTPDSIRNVAKCLFAHSDIDNIADLCCGSGGLGIAVWQQLKEPEKVAYFGMDIEPVMCDICTLMTYICGIPKSLVVWQDILRSPETVKSDKYDLVLLDVPRGQNRSIQAYEYDNWIGNIGQRNIFVDWIYVLRALNVLDDKGKGIVIVTSGTLTRRSETDLRKKVILNDWIEAVITLPANLYPNTRVGSEIIVFNKKKEKKREKKILFIDISKFYFRDNRNYYSISQKGIDLVADIFHKYYELQEISSIVDVSRIDEEIWSLKPLRYIGPESERATECHTLCLEDVAKIVRGVQLRKEEEDFLCKNGTALYLNIKDIREGRIHYEDAKLIMPKNSDWHDKFEIREDDILITSKGTSFKVAVVEEKPPEAYICGNLTLLRVDSQKYHPYILLEFLTSEEGIRALESIQSGTTIRVLNNANLARLQIPMYHQEVMNQVGNQLKEKRKKYETERKQLVENYAMERKILLELIGIEG